MNILFVNLPYQGHVIPTIGLVQELVKAGHRVTYLLPHDWCDRISGSGAAFLGYDNHPKLDRQIRHAFRKAEEVIREYDLLIYEQFFFPGKHLAEKYSKKCVRVFTSPATNRKLMADFLSHGGPMGIFRIPLISKLWTLDAVKGLGISLRHTNWLTEIVENPPSCNLVYSLRSFQPYGDEFPEEHFHFIGPSVYDRKDPPFPLPQRPVIYISLGTILKGAESFFHMCMEAFQNEDVTVVLSVGADFAISGLKHIPENFLVRNHVPQTRVLEQASLFITHGGMNSVSEAMAAGVPMVVIPMVSDQPVNAQQVEKLGLGRRLDYRSLTVSQLRETSLAVMSDAAIGQCVRKMKTRIAHAPGNAGAVKIIESL